MCYWSPCVDAVIVFLALTRPYGEFIVYPQTEPYCISTLSLFYLTLSSISIFRSPRSMRLSVRSLVPVGVSRGQFRARAPSRDVVIRPLPQASIHATLPLKPSRRLKVYSLTSSDLSKVSTTRPLTSNCFQQTQNRYFTATSRKMVKDDETVIEYDLSTHSHSTVQLAPGLTEIAGSSTNS